MENLIFNDLNISNDIKKALAEMGFESATPIQSQTIHPILDGLDVLGQAQTGTGKTCAFGIPAIEMTDSFNDNIQVLILCPTRELAIQSAEEIKNVSKYKFGIRILPIYGGQPIERQITALKRRPQIIIGTPGRVMDHLRRNTLKLSKLKMIILDEADEMLNMGFREDIDTILAKIPSERQTILFSATMPREILDLTRKYQNNPQHIKIANKELTVPSIEQYYIETSNNSKVEVLSRIIDTNNLKLSLVFCNTKKRVDEITYAMQSKGYSAESLHGDMRQEQRDKVMNQYRKGNFDILIATDVAARGIDVDDIDAVFNYDLPNDEEYYVHRIGRTGRAGRTGKAYSFIVGREILKLRDIQRYTKSTVQKISPPTLQDVEENKMCTILDNLKNKVSEKNYSNFSKYLDKILEELNSNTTEEIFELKDIAAALLQTISAQVIPQNPTLLDVDMDEQVVNNDEIVKLFMNIGNKNNIRPRNIIDCIVSSSGISGKLIGAINIFDNYTFVEIPGEYSTEIIESLKNAKINGKRFRVERSNKTRKVRKKVFSA